MPRGGDDQCEHKDHRQRRAHSNRLAWQRDADFERRIAAVRRGGLRTDGSTIAHIGRTKRHLLHATMNNSVLNDHQQSQQYRNPGTKRINERRRNQRSLFAGHHGATGTSATVLRTRSSSTADGLMLARLNVGSSTTKAVRRGAGRARGSPVHSTRACRRLPSKCRVPPCSLVGTLREHWPGPQLFRPKRSIDREARRAFPLDSVVLIQPSSGQQSRV